MPAIYRTYQAHLDLVEIWLYVAGDSIKTADHLLDVIEKEIRMIARSPGMGRKREELAKGLQSFPVSSYIIFYRVQKNGIEIIRVLHEARDIDGIFDYGLI